MSSPWTASVFVASALVSISFVGCSLTSSPVSPDHARRAEERVVHEEPDPGPPETGAPKHIEDGGPARDFADDARLLYRVVACGGSAELPARVDAKVVEEHCRELRPKIEAYKKRYVSVAKPFLSGLQPSDLPKKVVYPFSGGDLVTALTAYPKAEEITTLSLELAGDPRRLRSLDSFGLAQSLGKIRIELGELLVIDDYSKSETLKKTQRGDIPGELSFFMVSLAVHDLEPVSLKYFRVRPDGTLHYLSEGDITALEGEAAEHRKGTWTSPDFSEAFANVEIGFRTLGDDKAPIRVHRHIAQNLANEELDSTPGVLKHLSDKGDVAAMTKAASYLLWSDAFSSIRGYLVAHARFMVSDSTGVPPSFATDGGLVQETYGSFSSSLLHASSGHNAAMRKLWKSQPHRALPFRFGYHDHAGHDHLLVTKRPDAASSGAKPKAPSQG